MSPAAVRLACVVLAAAGGGVGCRHPEPPPPAAPAPVAGSSANEMPDWVRRTPSPPGEICAVGAVGRTFFTQDAHRRAGEAARLELAKTVEVRVSSVMLDVQTSRGGWISSSDVVSVVESVVDGVVQGAEVRSTWRDERGLHLAPGVTYALACLRADHPAEQLAEAVAVQGAASAAAVEGVRDRARAAFEDLEAEEARAGATGTDRESVNESTGANVSRPEEVP